MEIVTNSKTCAGRFNLSLTHAPNGIEVTERSWLLDDSTDCLQLVGVLNGNRFCFSIDLTTPQLNYRIKHGGGRQEPLAKAVGLKNSKQPTIIDATAGLGRESFLLWQLGCNVTSLERNPIIFALLDNAFTRLADTRSINGWQLVNTNAIDYLNGLEFGESAKPSDVVYLDPMFPERIKKAEVKLEMRIFKALAGKDEDAALLLEAARDYATNRVVVKRPSKASELGHQKPTFVVPANKYRFDVYLT